tara:strand:- start:1221 stop:1355 length:135 start_codon:yes stop_codon:yes gene_type:complete
MPISRLQMPKQLKGNRTKRLKQQAATAIAIKKHGIQPKRKQYAN